MQNRQLVITMLVGEDFSIDSFKDEYDNEFHEVVSIVETAHTPNLIKIGNVFGNVPVYVENIKGSKHLEVGDGPVSNINLYIEMSALCAIIPSVENTLNSVTSNGVEYTKDIYLGLDGKIVEAYDVLPDEITLAITNGAKKLTIEEYLAIVNKKPATKKPKVVEAKATTTTTKGKKK